MPSTRAMARSEEDLSWSPVKQLKRQGYLYSAIYEFLEEKEELSFLRSDEHVKEITRLVFNEYDSMHARIAEQVSHEKGDFAYYDHHKIIAGTQCAVLMSLPLRTQKNAQVSPAEVFANCGAYWDVIELNVDLAVYISLDILWHWQGRAAAEFYTRPALVASCTAQLVNYCGKRMPAMPMFDDFPLFWCSMLWYTIEELLPSEHKPSILTPTE